MQPTLANRPDLADARTLREQDQELLALVAAHSEVVDSGLPWATLNLYAEQIARTSTDGLRIVEILSGRGLSKQLALLVNHLIDRGLISTSTAGIVLTDAGSDVQRGADPSFAGLVQKAREVVDRAS